MCFAGFCEGNSGFCGTEPTIGRVQCNCSCKSSSLDVAPVTVGWKDPHSKNPASPQNRGSGVTDYDQW
jgi:hypothetical protein